MYRGACSVTEHVVRVCLIGREDQGLRHGSPPRRHDELMGGRDILRDLHESFAKLFRERIAIRGV